MPVGGALAGAARVVYEADVDRFKRNSRSAESEFLGGVDRMKRGVGGLGRAVTGLGGLLGVAGLGGAIHVAFGEMADGQRAAADVEAALKSTGSVAGVTAKHIDELSESLLRKSGVDDEIIKSGAAVLLTFTNVRNVVGQGNDVFDQAALSALNMSVRLKTDLQSSLIQVGKALQDPIRGMTSLRRVGVNFTEAQKEQVRALVETGRFMDAQKIILHELAVEFGGAAEAAGSTLPGRLAVAREEIANLSGELAGHLVPYLEDAVEQLIEWVDELESNKQLQQEIRQAVSDFADGVGTAADAVQRIVDLLGGWDEAIQLIVAASVVAKLNGLARAFTAVAVGEGAAAAGGAAATASATAGAAGAANQSGRLLRNLRGLKQIGRIAIPIAVTMAILNKDEIDDWFRSNVGGPIFGSNKPRKGDRITIGGVVHLWDGTWWVPVPSGSTTSDSHDRTNVGSQPGRVRLPTDISAGFVGNPDQGTHSRGERGYIWQDDDAVDIVVRSGQQIVAVANGRIHTNLRYGGDSGRFSGWGFTLLADNGDQYYYKHLKTVTIRAGQRVRAGQVLGHGSTVGHLHFARRGARTREQVLGGAVGPYGTTSPQPTSPAGGAAPPGGGGGGGRGGSGVIPRDLELDLAEAELTKTTRDDLRALAAIERYLEQRVSRERNVERRILLLRELKQTRERMAGLRKKEGRDPGEPELIPVGLELRLAEAELTAKLDDDIRVLERIEAHLEARLKKERNVNRRLQLLAELRQVRSQLATKIRDQANAPDTIDAISETERAKIEKGLAGGRGVRDVTDASGKVIGRELEGTPAVVFDPKSGKYIVTTVKPDVDALRSELRHLTGKVLPALDKRIKAVKGAIRRLSKHPKKNRAQLARLRATLAALQKERRELIALATDLAISVNDIDEALKLPPEPEETGGRESAPTEREPDAGADSDAGGLSQADVDRLAEQNVSGFLHGLRDLRQYQENILGRRDPFDPLQLLRGSNIVVINQFRESPGDPHTFARQLEFEIRAMVP